MMPDSQPLNTPEYPLAVLLCDIRSAYNVGAIFRTADAVGVTKMFLAGYTPAPTDRFGRARKDIAKAALGAEKVVPWRQVPDSGSCLAKLHAQGYAIVVLEQTPQSVAYTEYRPSQPVVLVIGNEIEGVPKEICALADVCIEIPMRGEKESLNVSVATGVALFQLRQRR